ncbi:MAG: hypothetical protein M1831_006306 [Alyxoria varia]|nr:MAG: hypothetical protein M1831_006306 [Alyxoria varia]
MAASIDTNTNRNEPSKLDSVSHPYVVFLGLAGMMTFISTVCMGLRFASRRLALSTSWDDWTCFGSLVFAYGFLVCTGLAATVGRAGHHAWEFDAETFVKYSQIQLATNVLYTASISLSKISILLLYRRLFYIVDSFCACTWVVGGFVVAFFFASTFGLVFSFSPVEAQWKFWLPHSTINLKRFWLSMSIVNLLLDVVVLSMPQARVWKLRQTMKRKMSLSAVFLLGGLVCIASILRIASIDSIDLNDLTCKLVVIKGEKQSHAHETPRKRPLTTHMLLDALTLPEIWSLIEMDLSIICACLPTFPNVFRYWYDGTLPHLSRNSVSARASGPPLIDRLRLKRPVVGIGYADLEARKVLESSVIPNIQQSVGKDLGGHERRSHHPLTVLEPVHVHKDIEVLGSPSHSIEDALVCTKETFRNDVSKK